MKSMSYKSTVIACYISNFSQAIVINITPIIFIPLKEQFGFSYSQFGLLVLVNFITQVVVDITFSRAVDKHGFRPFAIAAHIFCGAGLVLFALAPFLIPNNVYLGFLMATLIFSGGGGLFELLLSPIIDAIPSEEKEKAMSVLHSFYAWGQVAVVMVTTLSIFMGIPWWVIVLLWSVIPLLNTFLFAKVPLNRKVEADKVMKIKELLRSPVFLFAFGAILFGGASEVTMAQWASSFMEKGIALPKIVGDMLGMCGFAVMLGIGRLLYGIKGSNIDLERILLYGAMSAVVCYVMVAVSPFPWLSVLACCFTGLCVSLLWPGILVVAANRLPLAGASMFALLAAGGDIGASLGPWLTGIVADWGTGITVNLPLSQEQLALRLSILVAVIFPIIATLFLKGLSGCKRQGEIFFQESVKNESK